MVTFNQVPADLLEPFVAVEFDSSQAQTGVQLQPYRGVIIAQRLTTGTVPLSGALSCTAPTIVKTAEQAQTYFGVGSIAHLSAVAWLNSNRVTELHVVGVADAGGSTKAEWTITVTVTTAIAGTIFLYIKGVLVTVGVTAGMTQNAIASAINTAINAAFGLPVTSTVATNVVTLLARNAGTCGNSIDVRVNYYEGEQTPGGVTLAIAQSVPGATDPTIADALTLIGDTWYNRWVIGWRNSSTLAAMDVELERRWGPMTPFDGRAFFCARDTFANLATLAATLNSKHLLVFGRNKSMAAEWEYAAATAAITALSAQQDPPQPHQTQPLANLLGPIAIDDFDYFERDSLAKLGISTVYNVAGIERMGSTVTTYKKDANQAPDRSYQLLMTVDTLSFIRWSINDRISRKFPRAKYAKDSTRYGVGQSIATDQSIRGEVLAWFRELETAGIVEDFDQFEANLVVQHNPSNDNRCDILLPTNLINALIVRAIQIQFRT